MSMLLTVAVALLAIPQDQENPLIKMVRSSLGDETKPFTLVVRMKVKEGQEAKFEALVLKGVKETRKEKGNKTYELNRVAKGNEYILYERWENLNALKTHLETPHFTALMGEVTALLTDAPEVRLYVPVGE
jgi:quinol monooxygenase YgiN